jgi:hypothetical protein
LSYLLAALHQDGLQLEHTLEIVGLAVVRSLLQGAGEIAGNGGNFLVAHVFSSV